MWLQHLQTPTHVSVHKTLCSLIPCNCKAATAFWGNYILNHVNDADNNKVIMLTATAILVMMMMMMPTCNRTTLALNCKVTVADHTMITAGCAMFAGFLHWIGKSQCLTIKVRSAYRTHQRCRCCVGSGLSCKAPE